MTNAPAWGTEFGDPSEGQTPLRTYAQATGAAADPAAPKAGGPDAALLPTVPEGSELQGDAPALAGVQAPAAPGAGAPLTPIPQIGSSVPDFASQMGSDVEGAGPAEPAAAVVQATAQGGAAPAAAPAGFGDPTSWLNRPPPRDLPDDPFYEMSGDIPSRFILPKRA